MAARKGSVIASLKPAELASLMLGLLSLYLALRPCKDLPDETVVQQNG